MKKLIVTLMAILFLASTTGLIFAEEAATPAATPVAKVMKHKKAVKVAKVKKAKKVKKEKEAAAPAESTTPVAK
jgi:hypothetical protein